MAEETRPIEGPAAVEMVAPPSPQRFLGAATLVLMFFASASLTAAYLSNIQAGAQAQMASASTVIDPFAPLSLDAKAVYVADLATGKVLYAKNEDVQLPLASLAKVMLALAVSEALAPDAIVTVPPHSTPDGAPKRLPDGTQWHAQDLIDFTLVASSNEGASVLAEAADSVLSRIYKEAKRGGATLWRMNDLALNLGLTHTYFLNESGLDLSETQAGAFGSARDIALLFAYAASTSPARFEATARGGEVFRSLDGAKATVVNTDKILGEIPGLVMGKTGATDLAGGNLGVIFDVGPAHPVVAVVLHSTDEGRFSDMRKLVTAAQAAITEAH
ncbi:MAG: serine hydrolase [bacterium]|nr:serine hydrolase [bacterium]